jgi:Glyoxalase-like domain
MSPSYVSRGNADLKSVTERADHTTTPDLVTRTCRRDQRRQGVAVKLAAVTVDCEDALTVGRFWSAALGRPLDPNPSSDFAAIGMTEHRDVRGWRLGGDPTWLFARVPEGKTAKNRMHVDLAAADREAEVARLVGLGAKRVTDMDEWGYQWTVMQDPEGNEFCVAQTR